MSEELISNGQITLITGLPGNGKTLLAVKIMRELKTRGVHVAQMNFDSLDSSLAVEWPGPLENWKELPAGTVLFVDESQDHAAANGKGGSPEWVKDFSKVRHGGLRIVFLSQDPRFLDPWIRRLCNRHLHLVRTKGHDFSAVHAWDRCQENPVDYHALQSSEKTIFKYPKELFALYKSANIHTVKKSIPKKLWFFVAVIPVGIFAAWYAMHGMWNMSHKTTENISSGVAAASSAGAGATVSRAAWKTPEDVVKFFKPIIQNQPWTAPAYAEMKATDYPVLSCAATADRCLCLTQQGTSYKLPDDACRSVVQNGVFDPYNSNRKDKKERQDDVRTSSRGDPSLLSAEVRGGEGWTQAQRASLPLGGDSSALQVPRASATFDAGPRGMATSGVGSVLR